MDNVLLLFLLILVGFILCSYLGRFWEGMENQVETYTGPNGSTASIVNDNSLVVHTNEGTITYTKLDEETYKGENGGSVKVITKSDGTKSFIVEHPDGSTSTYNNGNTTTFTTSKSNTNSYDNYNHYNQSSLPNTFYGPDGGTARVIQTGYESSIVITNKNGTTEIYYIESNNNSGNSSYYYGPNGGSAKIVEENGKTMVEVTMPDGKKIVYAGDNLNAYPSQDTTINQYDSESNTQGSDYNAAFKTTTTNNSTTITGPAGNTFSTYDSSAYTNSLPSGIPRYQIPPGEEDLYILKSQVVPPVCPKCPDPITQCPEKFDASKCPPCPPCSRCPEPAFDCKKVPNYNAFNPNYMPLPVLSDFSTFGM